MLIGTYQFSCRFTDEAELPYFKGATFRGVFGRALKNVVCALKRNECSQCLLNKKCLYPHVFETSDISESVPGSRVSGPPHPFVIEPPLINTTHFQEDDPFDFNLVLFGEVNQSLPYFIYAFEQMGRIGLGRRMNGHRGRFLLEEVRVEDRPIYTSQTRTLSTDGTFREWTLIPPDDSGQETFALRIHLLTPLRFKFENHLKADLPFHILVRNMLRRISTLLNHYGEGEPDLDYKGMVARAREVRVAEDHLAWFDWRRYSFRQDRSMLMGGIIGNITYEGKIGEFMPLIDFCTKTHLGKQTTFGLGLIRAEKIK
ncbi:MAG: CRISPR system precrRNA processing endoribonuclease RAMP protein Cas6 [Deltaproteobacteria bacterium]|nr:CRISPR system precrRNA processing endoribonuclease RAMP protein Cas6 [Deltaproteobacteria bacterium]